MKNLQRLFLLAIFSFCILGNTFAQLTPDVNQPGVVIGAIHQYDVDEHAGSTYTWSVVDVDDNAILASATTYQFTDESIAFSRTIKWNMDGTYYLKAIETITATSCSNFFVIQVDVIGDSYSVQFVSTVTPSSNSIYCADDTALGSPEITLDVKLGATLPADTYYPMNVFYSLDGGTTELSASISNTNMFNLGAVDIGSDKTAPNTTAVTVTLLRIVDKNGVIFTPVAVDKEFGITINPIPGKPTITIL
ncbi:hypothetical protein [Labilibaculum antarcticum]|uniref:Uncharacterized protein n=1 Tax=Labilibaculum antarcticum TaxID=1717717 RepID=A0A1Y1CK17_9BACT|nr:hypothetical protein [Labilibaculum antarcticum]BAX80695.1 hypothetical protein ALGA_2368 [Labilibaculum antarcticum]